MSSWKKIGDAYIINEIRDTVIEAVIAVSNGFER